MLSKFDSLRVWLENVTPGTFQFGDSEYRLVVKLASYFGASPLVGDSEWRVVFKMASALGLSPNVFDPVEVLWAKIAENFGIIAYRDSTPMILFKLATMSPGADPVGRVTLEGDTRVTSDGSIRILL